MRKIVTLICVLTFFITGPAFSFPKKNKKVYGSYLKAITYFDNGRFEESLRELKKVKKLDPESAFIRLKLAFLLVKLEKFDQAEKELKSAQKLDPNDLEASLGLIFLYSYINQEDKLEEEYGSFLENAHKLRPEDINVSEYLAQFYFYKKKISDAIKIYETIVDKNPKNINARYMLGYFYEENGQRKKAIKVWSDSLKIDDSHADTLNSLGYIYSLDGKNLNQAKKLVEKALKLDPSNGAYLDSLGWIYFKKRQYKKAEKFLLEAVNNLQDPAIFEHLGDLYIIFEDIEKAVEYYKAGLKMNPDNQNLREKIEKYEKRTDNSSKENS